MKKRSFFTLLEVLVSMGVFMLLMLALMQFFTAAQNAWERSDGKAQLFDTARVAMDCLVNDLNCAFYAEDFENTTFLKYDSNPATITFATERSEGLTLVQYKYNSAAQKLEIREIKEKDFFDNQSSNNWITRDNDNWINIVSNASAVELAENIIEFSLESYKDKPDSGTPQQISGDTTFKPYPPFLLNIKMTVINERAKKVLDAMGKTDYANQTDWTEEQKDIYSQGTQTFKRSVIINRGQY